MSASFETCESLTTMAPVCEMCGVSDWSDYLIVCDECETSALHRYCLDTLPESDTEDVIWSCEQCEPKPAKVASPKRLSLRLKEQWEMKIQKWEKMKRKGAKISLNLKKRKKDRVHLPVVNAEVSRPDISSSGKLCDVSMKDNGLRSAGQLSDHSPLEEKKSLHLCNEKSDGGKKFKKKVRKLVLGYSSDEDYQSIKMAQDDTDDRGKKIKKQTRRLGLGGECSADEDYQSIKIAQDDTDQDFANGREIQVEKPSILSSSIRAIIEECNARSGPVSDACDAPLSRISDQLSVEYHGYVRAQPIGNPIWRGCFDIHNKCYGRIAGHLSSKAHSKVCEVASMFSPILSVEKFRRSVAWPKSFSESPPTEDNIGLYFFPESGRDESVFGQLLEEVIKEDLVLKAEIDKAELLIFSSFQLPEQDWKFYGQVYLWGAFRPRPRITANSSIERALSISVNGVDNQIVTDIKLRQSMSPVSTLSRSVLGFSQLNDDAEDLEKLSKQRKLNDQMNGQLSDFCVCVKEEHVEVGLCLELFPSQVENMAISAKMGQNVELDLELGLGRSMDKNCGRPLACKSKSGPCTLSLEEAIF